jgi:hypothetical protein
MLAGGSPLSFALAGNTHEDPNSLHVMRVQPSRKRLRADPADTVSRTIGSESRG